MLSFCICSVSNCFPNCYWMLDLITSILLLPYLILSTPTYSWTWYKCLHFFIIPTFFCHFFLIYIIICCLISALLIDALNSTVFIVSGPYLPADPLPCSLPHLHDPAFICHIVFDFTLCKLVRAAIEPECVCQWCICTSSIHC